MLTQIVVIERELPGILVMASGEFATFLHQSSTMFFRLLTRHDATFHMHSDHVEQLPRELLEGWRLHLREHPILLLRW